MSNELRWFGKALSPDFTEAKVIVLSDLHYGNPFCSLKQFHRTVDFIKKNDNCYCFLNGDLCEAVTKNSKGDVYTQKVTPQEQRDAVIALLKPIQDKVLACTTGNHEARIYNETGVDLTKDIAEALGVPYRPEGMLFKIFFGQGANRVQNQRYVFTSYITHGYGGARTKASKAVKVERTASWISADYYCLHPHTKILTGDLRWVELGSVNVGDELLGVSEYPEFNRTRKVLHTKVMDVKHRFSQTLKITLEDDTSFITTPDHLWLNKRRHDGAKLGGRYNWYRADSLSLGDELTQVFSKWETKRDWESGYIAGLFDGEGSITVGHRRERVLNFAQNEGLVLAYVESYLQRNNIPYHKYQNKSCWDLTIRFKATNLLGMIQPVRLKEKARLLSEKCLHKPKTLKIVDITKVGRREVITIETDIHTFLAEGIATHNCMSHDHVVNVSPNVYLEVDHRCHKEDNGFVSGKVTSKRQMLIKTNAYLKWGGYSESGGFPPSDLATPVINLLTPDSPQWELYPEKPRQGVKVSV